jgi:Flp pilus assembly protein TadD
MLAFAELHVPGRLPADRAADAIVDAGRALELDPGHIRALVVLGLAEEAAGRREVAREVVLRALQIHPGSELARQVLARVSRLSPGARP